MNLLGKLGIHPELLLAQAINFLILMFVLSRYLYAPLVSAIEERERKERETEASWRAIANEKRKVEAELDSMKKSSEERARSMIAEAETAASEFKRAQADRALADSDEIVKYAKQKAGEREQAQLLAARQEIESAARRATLRLIRGAHGREADRFVRRELFKKIERFNWSRVRRLIRLRQPGRKEFDQAAAYLNERLGPMPLSDLDLKAVLAAETPIEIEQILHDRLERTVEVPPETVENLRKITRPRARISSAFPLSERELRELITVIEKKIGEPVTPELHIDRSLLGGASIEVEGVRIDGTLASRLNRLVLAQTDSAEGRVA